MDNEIQIINPLLFPSWDEQILQYADYSIFHTSGWIKTIRETYSYDPQFFVAKHNESFTAAIPMMTIESFLTGRRAVSLPFSDYCEPLISEGINIKELFDFIVTEEQNRSVEVHQSKMPLAYTSVEEELNEESEAITMIAADSWEESEEITVTRKRRKQ